MFARVGRAGTKSAAVPVTGTGLSAQGGVAVFRTSVVMIVLAGPGEVAVLLGLVVLFAILTDVALSANRVYAERRTVRSRAVVGARFRLAAPRAVNLIEKCRVRLVAVTSFSVLLSALLIFVSHEILRVAD
jgi:hypothetical protein